MSCSVRRPLVDLPISRQMEIQNDAKFNSLIQDTSLRLRNCMDLINRVSSLIKHIFIIPYLDKNSHRLF
jgi:hypothetical protein